MEADRKRKTDAEVKEKERIKEKEVQASHDKSSKEAQNDFLGDTLREILIQLRQIRETGLGSAHQHSQPSGQDRLVPGTTLQQLFSRMGGQ